MICVAPSIAMPSNRVRVVWAFGVTIASLCPMSRFRRVDLPEFGAPISATSPQRVGSGWVSTTASGGVLLGPVDDLGMGREPDAGARFGVPDDFVENPDARTISDDMGVHRELEDSALVVGRVELAPEN